MSSQEQTSNRIPPMNTLSPEDLKEQMKSKTPSVFDERKGLKKYRGNGTIPIPTAEQMEQMKKEELTALLIRRRDAALKAVARKVDSLTNRYKTIEAKINKTRVELNLRQAQDRAMLEEIDKMIQNINQHKQDMATCVLQLQIEDRLLQAEESLGREVEYDE